MNGADEQTRDVLEVHQASARTPLVAIVTPVYNGAQFLAATMDAVQAQTYPNLIHIIHDNASTDETASIIARYANPRVPIRVARNERTLPMNDNWNAAISRVPKEAKYFGILCADDIIAPDFTSHLTELMEQNPSVIVAGCDVATLATPDIPWENQWERDRSVFSGKEAVGRFFLGKGNVVVIHALIRRDALEFREPFIDPSLMLCDTDMCLDLLRHGDWGYVHETLAFWNDHSDSVTSVVTRPSRIGTRDMLVLLERYASYGLGEERATTIALQYKRYYLRQLLLWSAMNRDTFNQHTAALKRAGHRPYFSRLSDFWELADALVDWGYVRLGLREPWRGLRGL